MIIISPSFFIPKQNDGLINSVRRFVIIVSIIHLNCLMQLGYEAFFGSRKETHLFAS